jgi:hypothetical protein
MGERKKSHHFLWRILWCGVSNGLQNLYLPSGAQMANFGLIRVKRDPATGRIIQGQLQSFDGARNKWDGEAFVEDAATIAKRLFNGDTVISIFGGNSPINSTRHGAALAPRLFDDGFQGIALISESEGRTMDDFLPLD